MCVCSCNARPIYLQWHPGANILAKAGVTLCVVYALMVCVCVCVCVCVFVRACVRACALCKMNSIAVHPGADILAKAGVTVCVVYARNV